MVSMNCDPILQSVTAFFKGISSVQRGRTSAQHVAEKTIENKACWYSVLIPENLAGYDPANPFYRHGFGTVLGEESKSYIIVDGERNRVEFARPADACMQGRSFVQ
jgi:hypothetical protein